MIVKTKLGCKEKVASLMKVLSVAVYVPIRTFLLMVEALVKYCFGICDLWWKWIES